MRIKVCGNTAVDTAMVAVDAGADMLGFIMVEGTPRTVTPARARAIAAEMPPDVDLVGVFADRPIRDVAEIAAEVGFTVVQLHGAETWEDAAALDLPVIKGQRMESAGSATEVSWPPGGILLVDAHRTHLPGGTGEVFPWEWAEDLGFHYRLMVSGGLHAGNVGDAVRHLRPWGVDASSRLEASPGVKDPDRVREYVRAARAAELELAAVG
jgi:phosphoribosylanthranilate isomerase